MQQLRRRYITLPPALRALILDPSRLCRHGLCDFPLLEQLFFICWLLSTNHVYPVPMRRYEVLSILCNGAFQLCGTELFLLDHASCALPEAMANRIRKNPRPRLRMKPKPPLSQPARAANSKNSDTSQPNLRIPHQPSDRSRSGSPPSPNGTRPRAKSEPSRRRAARATPQLRPRARAAEAQARNTPFKRALAATPNRPRRHP